MPCTDIQIENYLHALKWLIKQPLTIEIIHKMELIVAALKTCVS